MPSVLVTTAFLSAFSIYWKCILLGDVPFPSSLGIGNILNLLLINSKEYDYSKKSDTVEYYINEFNNYEKNVNIKIARDFIMKLNYPQTDKVYNLSKYMNIKFLTEELFKFNIKKIIEMIF